MILIAGSGITKQDDVIIFVLNISQIVLFGKVHQIIRDHLGIPGAMGNGANLFKITEYGCRFQTCKSLGFHNSRSLSQSMGLL